MEINIISLENRKGTKLGETKKVRRGYARYLVRTKKALPYDKAELEQFSKMRADLEQQEAEKLGEAKARADKLKELNVQIMSRAQEEGQLYGSLGPKEIAEAVNEKGILLDKKDVHLEHGLIRKTGNHEVMIHLHDEVKVKIIIEVIPASS